MRLSFRLFELAAAFRVDRFCQLAFDFGEEVFGWRDARGLHPIDQLVAFEREQCFGFVLMEASGVHEFEYRELADARGEVGLGKFGVEDVVRKIEFEIHYHSLIPTFRNRQTIVKRGEGEITLY